MPRRRESDNPARELLLRLTREESIELYIHLIKLIRQDTDRQTAAEVYDIIGKLQRRMSEFEIEEFIRVTGSLSCGRCNSQGFLNKQLLVWHVQECYGVDIAEAITIVHNLFRPALILKGRSF